MGGEEGLGGKLEKAAAMLLFRSHRKPGVKCWELKHALGKNYLKIVDALNAHLKKIGLEVKTVLEEGEDLDNARFYVVLSHPLTLSDVVTASWSIDEVAALATVLSIIASRGGKAPLNEVLEALQAKFPKWKAESHIEKAIRRGYVEKTEDDVLLMGWRAKVELDQRELLKAILEFQASDVKEGEESLSNE